MPPGRTSVSTPEPTDADLDRIVQELESSWTARVTVRRQSNEDTGLRQIYVSLDHERLAVLEQGQEVSREVAPGRHHLRVHNTLFWKRVDFTLDAGEHASFVVINRAGFGTYSIVAYLLGTNVMYLTLERETFYGARR
jgi:hypothetical protein